MSVLVILVMLPLEKTLEAERVFGAVCDYLQGRLSEQATHSVRDRSLPPIVIVDISGLPPGKDGATPRKQLRNIIGQVMQWNPRSVGIDIDFSPSEKFPEYWATHDDPGFMDYCLKFKNKLYLGAARSLGLPRRDWFVVEQYADLATALYVERGARKMLKEVTAGPDGERGEACTGMAYALAGKPSVPQNRLFGLAHFADELQSRGKGGQSHRIGNTFFIDYSQLEKMQRSWYKPGDNAGKMPYCCIRYDQLDESSFKVTPRAIVLIGDAKQVTDADSFVIPDRADMPVPGVFVHACAVDTLLKGPLYWVGEADSRWIDGLVALLAAVVIGGAKVACLRYQRAGAFPCEKRFELLSWAIEWAGILTFLALGVVYVFKTRVYWYTFPCVMLAQLLRRPVRMAAEPIAQLVRGKIIP